VTDELAWETVVERVAYECPGFAVVSQDVRLPDGETTDFDYLSEPPAVVVLPLTDDGEVVCIEEWRQAVGRVNRGLPVGTVEPDDDDLDAAARRELREETGHVADAVEHVVTLEPANGVADSVHHYYRATGCEPAGDQSLDADESIRVTPTPYEDLRAAVRDGEVRDGRAATAVLYEELRD
jgi:ADP-ribose pyrophosphatase